MGIASTPTRGRPSSSSVSLPRASPRCSAAAWRRADPSPPVLLSVLDQSPIRAGGTAADAVAETLELAQACPLDEVFGLIWSRTDRWDRSDTMREGMTPS